MRKSTSVWKSYCQMLRPRNMRQKEKKSSILFNAPGESSTKTFVHFEKEGPKVSFGHTLACMAVSFSERSFVLNLQPFFSSKNDLSKK